ncbi:hypothetical protein MAR_032546 [Mya arenaria]|uniref:Uncharacterized protein n=1 Tax=Mya arenaria TaxID=6604 RepID=A0ABY7FAA5_MYAAR|nr:hypothetical protein MAR_032546 [Mya arenaria]
MNRLHFLQPFDHSKQMCLQLYIQLCYTPLYTLPTNYFVICFHNAHLEDIVSERNFSRADVLILTESKLCAKDIIQIPGRTLHRNDFAFQKAPYGSIVITKPQHQVHVEGPQSTSWDYIDRQIKHRNHFNMLLSKS